MNDLTPGQRIRQVRTSLGLTQVEFAKAIGITQPSLARIEKDRAVPSDTLIKFVELIATLQPTHDWIKLNAPALLGR